jgi:hypothetical protein
LRMSVRFALGFVAEMRKKIARELDEMRRRSQIQARK